MTIYRAVKILESFIEEHMNDPFTTGYDLRKQLKDYAFQQHKNKSYICEFLYKLDIAIAHEFILIKPYENRMGDAIQITKAFSEYCTKRESLTQKFIHALIGSIITVFGGLIGALITALI